MIKKSKFIKMLDKWKKRFFSFFPSFSSHFFRFKQILIGDGKTEMAIET